MHIGFVIYGHLDSVSGGYLYDRKLVEYLRRQGDQVEIISLPWSNYGRHLTHNFLPGLNRRLRQASFDVLLQDELNHPSLFWLNRRLRSQRLYPLVSVVHHLRSSETKSAWQKVLYGRVEKKYLASVDGFVFNSRTTRTTVERMVGSRRPHVIAYPAGNHMQPTLSVEAIQARAHEPGPLRLLFVGNVIARKGLESLLAALAGLPFEWWRLDVIGDMTVEPAYTRQIGRQIEAAGLGCQVTLHGSVPEQVLREHFYRSHLLAVPSHYEGFGIVYLEGMGFGLPALAGTSGAAHEIITHGEDGWLASAGESAEVASYVAGLHHDRERLVRMSVAARRRYLAQPTWEESMARVWQFLKEMEVGDWRLEIGV